MERRLVSELWIYPVKSLGGVSVESATVKKRGLALDRRWMLIDEEGMFMSQRTFPNLALFKLSYSASGLSIQQGADHITLPLSYSGTPLTARVWNDTVTVHEVSETHSAWFTGKLGVRCRLVVFPEEYIRPVDPRYALGNDQVSLADGYPLLIIGQASLDDLNRRMKGPLPMNRFRPNIVFTGGEAFEEDRWGSFRVGDTRLAAVKPCSRCVVTTIDQENGTSGVEPLATLSGYRRLNNKVFFGQNLIPLEEGEIRLGDEIIPG